VLVESKNNKLVFAIENKLDGSEGDTQLSRYESIVKSQFPNDQKLFAYLTKEGDPASDQNVVDHKLVSAQSSESRNEDESADD
jgi:hypothetical protein